MRPNIIPSIFTATGNYTPAVIRMTEATEGLGLASKSAARSMGLLSLSSKGVTMGSASFLSGSAGALALVAGLVFAGKAAMDFEQQMGNIATLVDTSKESIGAMGDAVMKLGKTIPKPISDMTEGLYQVRSAGIGAKDAFDVMNQAGQLSVAGLSTFTEATKAITSALVSFKNEGLSSSKIANSFFLTVKEGKTKMDALNESFGQVAAIAASANIKLDDFLSATAALTNTGLTASESMLSLRQFLIALKKPSSEMADVLEGLGFTGADAGQKLIDKFGTIGNIMEALRAKSSTMGDNINKALGRAQALVGYTALTGQQKGQYLANLKEREAGENMLTQAFEKQNATAAAQFQIFKNGITQLGVRIGNTLLPPLNSLLKVLNPVFDLIGAFAQDHKPITKLLLMGAAVAGLNKYFGIYNGLLRANAFLSAFAAVKAGTLTGALIATEEGAAGAKLALGGFNATIKRSLFWVTLLTASYESLLSKIDENRKGREFSRKYNPLGFDFDKDAKANKSILNKYGLTDDQYNQFQGVYNKKDLAFKIGGNSNPIGDFVYNSFKKSPLLDSLPKGNADSALKVINKTYLDTNYKPSADTATEMPFVPATGSINKSKTDEYLGKIYDVLKNNAAAMQPQLAYAGNQNSKRVPITVYPTFNQWTS